MTTMLNLSLIDIGNEYGVGSHDLGYVNTLFLLGSAIGMVPAAKYGSIHGMKKVFTFGIIGASITAVLTTLSPNFWFLIAMRLVTGLFTSMVMVTSVSMISLAFPIEKRGWAIGVNTSGIYLGHSIGPTVGGVLSDVLGWRFVFVLVVILFVIALALSFSFKGEMRPSEGRSIDWTGMVFWTTSLFVLMFGTANMTEAWAWAMICIGLVMMFYTVRYLSRAEFPVLNVKLFRNATFSKASIACFMNHAASYSVTFFLALYLQSIGAMTAWEAGLFMLIQPVVQVFVASRAGALFDRLSDKRLVPVFAAAMTVAGVTMFLFLSIDMNAFYVAVMMVVLGIGIGCFGAPVNAVMVNVVPREYRGDASGVVAVVRQTGMVTSMGIAMASIQIIMGSTDNLGPGTYGDFIEVIRLAFSVCLIMCLVSLACCATLGRGGQIKEP